MEKKIANMTANEVAAMRKAHKEAESAYFQAKVGALESSIEEMKATGKEYNLNEIADMTGLTHGEVAAQFGLTGIHCHAAAKAGFYRYYINHYTRCTERHFVEILPNGEINPSNIINLTQHETVIRVSAC